MTIFSTFLLLIAIFQLCLGVHVLLSGPRQIIRTVFFIFSLGVSIWLASLILVDVQIFPVIINIILDRLTFVGVLIVLSSIVHFSLILNLRLRQNQITKITTPTYFAALIFILLAPTDLLSANQGSRGLVPGVMFPVFGAYAFFCVVFMLYNLLTSYFRSQDETKKQLFVVFVGYFLAGLFALLFNVVFPVVGITGYEIYGAGASIFVTICMSYAIQKYSLFRARIASVNLFLAALVLLSFLQLFWPDFLDQFSNRMLTFLIILAICIISFKLIRSKYTKPWGVIYDDQARPMGLAIVRIWSFKSNKLLETTVTGEDGRYYFLVDSGEYYITVDKDGFNHYESGQINIVNLSETTKVNRDIFLHKKIFNPKLSQSLVTI